MDLTLDEQRVDDGADIVDHDIAEYLCLAGFRIDLDLADMTAVGEACLMRGNDCGGGEPIFRLIGNARGNMASARHLFDANRAVGSGDAKGAGVKLDIPLTGLETLRGNLAGARENLLRRADESCTADHQRARAECAASMRDQVRVAGSDANVVRMQSQKADGDLPESSLMPLAMIVCAKQNGQIAVRIEAQIRSFFVRVSERATGDLDRIDDATA